VNPSPGEAYQVEGLLKSQASVHMKVREQPKLAHNSDNLSTEPPGVKMMYLYLDRPKVLELQDIIASHKLSEKDPTTRHKVSVVNGQHAHSPDTHVTLPFYAQRQIFRLWFL